MDMGIIMRNSHPITRALTVLIVLGLGTMTRASADVSASIQIVKPNLMVLLSNSASMNLDMSGTGYPNGVNGTPIENQCPANYSSTSDYTLAPVFSNDSGCGGTGTPFPYDVYGNLPDSRFYIAKSVLYNALKNGYANSINLGFATYRQAMGLELSTSSSAASSTWPDIYLPGQQPGYPSTFPSPYNTYTPSQLSSVASNPLNFSFLSWYDVYNSVYSTPNGDSNLFLGNGDSGVFEDGPLPGTGTNYLSNNSGQGGLPFDVVYPQGRQQNSSVISGTYIWSYYGAGGLTPQQAAESPQAPEPVMQLCMTYYNSQSNTFQALYNINNPDGTPDDVQQTFPNLYSGNTLNYISLDSPQYNSQGQQSPVVYTQSCNVGSGPNGQAPSSVQVGYSSLLVSNQIDPVVNDSYGSGVPAYFNYIPNYLSGTSTNGSILDLTPGSADGWSGDTSESSGDGGVSISSTYPATPQSESILGSYDQSGSKWMGVFVNLPPPATQTSNVSTIERLINPAYPDENSSGLEYSYSNQTLTSNGSNRSIAPSTESGSYDGNQEPLYDSLVDAYAYWKAFESTNDLSPECSHNNMLVIFDGISDGHTSVSINTESSLLTQEASALYKNLGVKVFVVIISDNAGDIAEANALAYAGGTKTAYTAQNSQQLTDAIQSTFTVVSQESVSASFGVSPSSTAGSYEFSNNFVSRTFGQGDLDAYQVGSNGQLNQPTSLTPAWNAESIMNTSDRTSSLYGTAPGGSYGNGSAETVSALASNDPSIFNSTTPSPSTIASYTIDPSFDGGIYLGGRQSGWFIGLPSGSAPIVISPPSSSNLLNSYTGVVNSYLPFAAGHMNRQNAVLFSSNDGFLYAIGYNNSGSPSPTLLWGWMPQSLMPYLSNYSQFWQNGNMNGGFSSISATNDSGQWHTYVSGSDMNGQDFYDLQLSGTTEPDLKDTIWEQNLGSGYSQPQVAAPVYTQNQNVSSSGYGQTVSTWAVNDTSTTGSITYNLLMENLGDGDNRLYALPFSNTATPFYGLNGSMYLGSSSGNVYSMSSTNLSVYTSLPKPGSAINTGSMPLSKFIDLGNVTPWSASLPTNISNFVEGVTTSKWLSVQTPQGFTVMKQVNGVWAPQWSSFAGGAGTWSGSTFNLQTSGGSGSITALPAGSSITDAPVIVQGILIVPVSVPSTAANSCGVNSAYYYLYNLDAGTFPNGQLTSVQGNAVTGPILIGYGKAFTPSVTAFNGRELIQASASNTNSSKVFSATINQGLPSGGPVQWKVSQVK